MCSLLEGTGMHVLAKINAASRRVRLFGAHDEVRAVLSPVSSNTSSRRYGNDQARTLVALHCIHRSCSIQRQVLYQ